MIAPSYWCPTCQTAAAGYTAPDGGAVLCRECGEILVDRPDAAPRREVPDIRFRFRKDGKGWSVRIPSDPPEWPTPHKPWRRYTAENERYRGDERTDREVWGPVWTDPVTLDELVNGRARPGVDTTPSEPTLDQLTAAVQDSLDAALMHVAVTQEGQTLPLSRLVRVLDRAGLIDWAAVTTSDEETQS